MVPAAHRDCLLARWFLVKLRVVDLFVGLSSIAMMQASLSSCYRRLRLLHLARMIVQCAALTWAMEAAGAGSMCVSRLETVCPAQAARMCEALPEGRLPAGTPDAELDRIRERRVLVGQYESALELGAAQLLDELSRPAPALARVGDLTAGLFDLLGWNAHRHAAMGPAMECAELVYARAPADQFGLALITLAARTALRVGPPAALPVLSRIERWRHSLPQPTPPEIAGHLAFVLSVEADILSKDIANVHQVVAVRRLAVAMAEQAVRAKPDSKSAIRTLAITKDNLANALLADPDRNSIVEAEGHVLSALRLKRGEASNDHDTTATSYATLGRLRFRQDRTEEGLSAFRRAVLILWAGNDEVTSDQLFIMSRLADLSAELADQLERRAKPEDLVEAITFFRLSVDARQRMRLGARSLPFEQREEYTRAQSWVYRRLASLLFSQGRHAEANAVALMLQSAEIGEVTRGPPEGLTPRAKAESAYLARLLRDVQFLDAAGSSQADVLDAQIGQVRNELVAASQDTPAMDLANKDRPLHIAISRLAQQGDRAAAIVWVPLESFTVAWVTTPESVRPFLLKVNQQQLDDLVLALATTIRLKQPDASSAARKLHAALLDDIVKWLDARPGGRPATLVLAPVGSLRAIPFAALPDANGSLLFRRFQLSHIAAGSIGQLAAEPMPAWRVAAFGSADSPVQSGLPRLDNVKSELYAIAQDDRVGSTGVLPGHIVFDPDFKPDVLKDVLRRRDIASSRPNVVHVSSHFVLKPNWPDSFLVASGGQSFKVGWIQDTTDLVLTGFDLISLSACGTEVGNDVRKQETIGSALLERGAASVLGTLWNANDAAAARLMKAFYHAARGENRKINKAVALQQAQELLLGDPATAHPYYWAPYILMGSFR